MKIKQFFNWVSSLFKFSKKSETKKPRELTEQEAIALIAKNTDENLIITESDIYGGRNIIEVGIINLKMSKAMYKACEKKYAPTLQARQPDKPVEVVINTTFTDTNLQKIFKEESANSFERK